MDCYPKKSPLISIDDALANIFEAVSPLRQETSYPLESAIHQTLSQPIIAEINVPSVDNSALDGYAFRAQDLEHTQTFTMIGKSFAGHPFEGTLSKGECIRIMTGAKMPDSADTVIMQENTRAEGNHINFIKLPKPFNAVRRCGEDIAIGQTVYPEQHIVSPLDVGILASLGISEVSIYRPIKVAIFSTGDELKQPGTPLQEGDIYDSNRPAIKAILSQYPIEVIDLGNVKDDPNAILQTFQKADQLADIVISTGGVSVGEADYTRDILMDLGDISFWKVAIKPGKPLAFGQLKSSFFFGLPGNPVSAIVTLQQFVIPAINQLRGLTQEKTPLKTAITTEALKKSKGRTDYQRGIFQTASDGHITVKSTGSQGSGMLTSMAKANCFIILEQNRGNVEAGESVQITPFN